MKSSIIIIFIKSKISKEVEETNIKISKERDEISKKEDTINRLQKGIDLLVCERDFEKKRCEFFAANADLDSALEKSDLFGVQKAVFILKSLQIANFRFANYPRK
jgi:hypothetical protein